MATPQISTQIDRSVAIQQDATISPITWNRLPLEIRHKIIPYYLASCWNHRLGFWHASRGYGTLNPGRTSRILAVSYKFGQQDVLQPLHQLHKTILDHKYNFEVLFERSRNSLLTYDEYDVLCSKRIFLEDMDKALEDVSNIISELLRQQVCSLSAKSIRILNSST